MTSDNLKRAIRAYMAEHGVNYTTAKRAVTSTSGAPGTRASRGWVLGDLMAGVRVRLSTEAARAVCERAEDFLAEVAEFPAMGDPEHPGLLKRSVDLGDYVVPVQMPYVLASPEPLVEDRWWESDGTPRGDVRAAQPGAGFLAEAAIPEQRVGYRMYDNTFTRTRGLRASGGLINPHGFWRPQSLDLCNPEQQRLIGSWRDSDGDPIALVDALQDHSTVIFDVAHVVEDLCADFPASYRVHHVAGSTYLDHADDPGTRQMLSTATDTTWRYLHDKALEHFLIAIGLGSAALARGPLGDPEGPEAAGSGSVLDQSVAIPWLYLHNRPFLRSLFGAAWCLHDLGETAAARYLYQQCLCLCPDDVLIVALRLEALSQA